MRKQSITVNNMNPKISFHYLDQKVIQKVSSSYIIIKNLKQTLEH